MGIKGRYKMSKNLGVATAIYTDQEYTKVIYHDTPVVSFNRDKIILDTAYWWSNTTKKRMNQVSEMFNLGYYVYQKDNQWYVDYRDVTYQFDMNGINHNPTLTLSRANHE